MANIRPGDTVQLQSFMSSLPIESSRKTSNNGNISLRLSGNRKLTAFYVFVIRLETDDGSVLTFNSMSDFFSPNNFVTISMVSIAFPTNSRSSKFRP